MRGLSCADVVQTHMCTGSFTCRIKFPHLDAVFYFHVSQQFAVDAEETKLSLVVIDHTVSLCGGLDEAGPREAVRDLQGPQQVPIHGMDQTRTLCRQMRKRIRRRSTFYVHILLVMKFKS